MNPFNEKNLEEFTISDCYSYLRHYPYGEHVMEVKVYLQNLKTKKRILSEERIQSKTEEEKLKHENNQSPKKEVERKQRTQKEKTQKLTSKPPVKVPLPLDDVIYEPKSEYGNFSSANVANMILKIILTIGVAFPVMYFAREHWGVVIPGAIAAKLIWSDWKLF